MKTLRVRGIQELQRNQDKFYHSKSSHQCWQNREFKMFFNFIKRRKSSYTLEVKELVKNFNLRRGNKIAVGQCRGLHT